MKRVVCLCDCELALNESVHFVHISSKIPLFNLFAVQIISRCLLSARQHVSLHLLANLGAVLGQMCPTQK